MKTAIEYNVCRGNLGDDTTDAQYAAFKLLVESAIKEKFSASEYQHVAVTIGDSDFCNASTCSVNQTNIDWEKPAIITRSDVEEAASEVDESWWDAE